MWRILIAGMMAIALVGPVSAQNAQIQGVIRDQFDDFRADDLVGAFDHASPKIQGLFGTPENFGAMVRRGYPMVWRPQTFRFLDLSDAPPEKRQVVEVTDAEGRRFLLRYDMIELEAGWKINGVLLIPAPDVAA